VDQGRQGRQQMDAALVPTVRCAGVQPGQSPAHARGSGGDQGLGVDQSAGQDKAKVVRHGRYVAFQMAEVAIPRQGREKRRSPGLHVKIRSEGPQSLAVGRQTAFQARKVRLIWGMSVSYGSQHALLSYLAWR
jgi:hypothetical protein